MELLASALAATLALTGAAYAQTETASAPKSDREAAGPTAGPRSGERADIPFANARNGIRTFTPEDRGYGVYLEDNQRNWYYASFIARCTELPFAFGFGIQTFGRSSALSRGDTIIAGAEACRIHDIVRSGPPPEKPRKARKAGKAV